MRFTAPLLALALLVGSADAYMRGFSNSNDSEVEPIRRQLKSSSSSEETGKAEETTKGGGGGGGGDKSGGGGGGDKSGGTAGNTDRANVGPDGQCIRIPTECGEGGGAINCGFWNIVNNPAGVNRAADGYPVYNRVTCIYEPRRCVDFETEYNNAVVIVDAVLAVGGVPSNAGYTDDEFNDASIIRGIGAKMTGCWTEGGEFNQPGVCCRYHSAKLEPDAQQIITTQPCVCNSFTADKIEDDGSGGFTR